MPGTGFPRDRAYPFSTRKDAAVAKPTHVQGFTLLEVLVVMVIIAITTGLAVLSVRTQGPAESLEAEAQRLATLIRLGSDEAVIGAAQLGLAVERDAYAFLGMKEDKWVPLEEKPFASRRDAPPISLKLSVRVDGQEVAPDPKDDEEEKLVPQVALLSNGEITPFQITLASDEVTDLYYVVSGNDIGVIEVEKVDGN